MALQASLLEGQRAGRITFGALDPEKDLLLAFVCRRRTLLGRAERFHTTAEQGLKALSVFRHYVLPQRLGESVAERLDSPILGRHRQAAWPKRTSRSCRLLCVVPSTSSKRQWLPAILSDSVGQTDETGTMRTVDTPAPVRRPDNVSGPLQNRWPSRNGGCGPSPGSSSRSSQVPRASASTAASLSHPTETVAESRTAIQIWFRKAWKLLTLRISLITVRLSHVDRCVLLVGLDSAPLPPCPLRARMPHR